MLKNLQSEFKTDKFSHGYTSVYENYFSQYIEKNVTLLEIGVKKRAKDVVGCESLLLWKKFLPNARVIGLDIIDVVELQLSNPNVELYQIDCRDHDSISNLLSEKKIIPDIVIDDGAHTPRSHQIAFSAIFPRMWVDGKYFIEDLQTCINRENFLRWEVTDENNTFKWLADLELGISRSIFLTKEQNELCCSNVKEIKFFCQNKLSLIMKS